MRNTVPAVIAKIISRQKNLTFSENEIANFVINNAEFVINNTITNIAIETKVSETSINRFCKKIGFKGFNDFKIALAQDNFYRNLKANDKSRDNNSLIDSIASDYNELILNTCSLINEMDLIKVVEMIKSAKKVNIFSVFGSWQSAIELKQRLNMMGIKAESYNDVYSMKLCSANSSQDDLIIGITRNISVRDIQEPLISGRQNNAKIVTITSYDSPKLSELTDIKIITSDKLAIENNTVISDNMTFLFTIDVIVGMLIKSNKKYLQKKLDSDALFESEQDYSNYYYNL
ncbi:MurR/RpiR family transcriptional regulator [Clostridium beijerinckii]|jgi:Transcriptional regulators|uniref:MurR/RpiR family transcriptional regulator n=3 Tax=Clostridium beijerinckii TaxID=1520 RepID=A0AAE2RUI1_CLOBE|nr:MurR/RpiR family transcriptional regulator [Clostridium beijerinckii]ABR35643.1 transcriptional regulator, RpiR family [Clostridium beijerinckii NCIMB 8052]AIU02555.1 RpiR family transcriptional regulator [Clostridium beijerinckii ATCC 35702]MBF7809718.1 MurR/RpiR family transcriptional regulator [Clostridium beijerinckii]NOW90278.1 DNA-binding MurR/RpiR family transcriptional regulator [Clostridium beijerinckii]NRT69504.1 DNA-binding MurR/RpiR family transcriptional regulator [Clostridium 